MSVLPLWGPWRSEHSERGLAGVSKSASASQAAQCISPVAAAVCWVGPQMGTGRLRARAWCVLHGDGVCLPCKVLCAAHRREPVRVGRGRRAGPWGGWGRGSRGRGGGRGPCRGRRPVARAPWRLGRRDGAGAHGTSRRRAGGAAGPCPHKIHGDRPARRRAVAGGPPAGAGSTAAAARGPRPCSQAGGAGQRGRALARTKFTAAGRSGGLLGRTPQGSQLDARTQSRVIGIFVVCAARLQAHTSRRGSAASLTPVFTACSAAHT